MKISPVRFSVLFVSLFVLMAAERLSAQETAAGTGWTPEEQRELFGYCDKPQLIKLLKISPETADKIGQINFWATNQKISVAANTNDTFATAKEVEEVVIKKYKALGLAGDQLKELVTRREKTGGIEPCPITVLTYNHYYDTLSAPRIIQLYKTPITLYRKPLIDKTGILGRQADQVIEIEAWKQKEAMTIAALPDTDFNKIRKTVALYNERERRYRVVGLGDQQIQAVIDFFEQNPLGPKK